MIRYLSFFKSTEKEKVELRKINVRQSQRLRYETYFSRWLDLLFSQQSPCGNCCKLNSKSEGKTFLLHLVLCWLSCLLWRQTGDFCELLDFGLHGVWFIIKTIHTHYHYLYYFNRILAFLVVMSFCH